MKNIEQVIEFIKAQSPETEIFIGCDSERINVYGEWFADYALAVVVHIDGKHGCKVFGDVIRERDYDQKADRPSMRLMTEVYKVAELYTQLKDVVEDKHVEIHLDVNPKKDAGSSIVVQQAIGYIRGVCNRDPQIKPRAFAASYAADRMKFILSNQNDYLHQVKPISRAA